MGLTSGETIIVILFYVFLVVLLIGFFIFWSLSVRLVRQAEVMIIERFGKYRNTLKPGLHFLVPFIDTPRKIHWRYVDVDPNYPDHVNVKTIETERIDMREHIIDFGKQHVITKDTVQIDVDALVYYQITDPELAVFKIQNLPDAIELLTQTTLRNIIAQMTLDDTFSSRELINAELKEKTGPDCERWGVTITNVEIMNIIPPADIKQAMEMQIKEERERRSTVLHADGQRESAVIRSKGDAAKLVLKAEGEKTSKIQVAKGSAEAKQNLATAEAESIRVISEALRNSELKATDYLTAVQYLESLQKVASRQENSTVTFIPSDTIDFLSDLAVNAKKKN